MTCSKKGKENHDVYFINVMPKQMVRRKELFFLIIVIALAVTGIGLCVYHYGIGIKPYYEEPLEDITTVVRDIYWLEEDTVVEQLFENRASYMVGADMILVGIDEESQGSLCVQLCDYDGNVLSQKQIKLNDIEGGQFFKVRFLNIIDVRNYKKLILRMFTIHSNVTPGLVTIAPLEGAKESILCSINGEAAEYDLVVNYLYGKRGYVGYIGRDDRNIGALVRSIFLIVLVSVILMYYRFKTLINSVFMTAGKFLWNCLQRNRLKKLLFYLFIIITTVLLLYRISIHADIYDEIINLGVSYRIALGDIPFYNCWEAFQSGDIFMAPFIWIYIKIFHSTTGLILYCRFIYIAVLTCVSAITYCILKKYIKKSICFQLSYVIIFFNLYSLFYLWYDSVSVIFLLLGNLFLLSGLECVKKLQKLLLFFGAGIIHCCMAFSYPAFAILALGIAIILLGVSYNFYGKSYKQSFYNVFWYAFGALIFIALVLLYLQLTAGLSNVFSTLNLITQTRSANSFSILNILKDIIIAYVSANKYFIPVTIVVGIIYFCVLKNEKCTTLLLFSIIILPAFNQFFVGKNTLMGLANYLSYLALWCPFMYYLINEKRNIDKCMMYIFYIPSILSTILISTTTVYADIGPVKSWQASLPGALASLFFMVTLWKDRPKGELYSSLSLKLVVLVLLANAFSYIYLNQPYITRENQRMPDGVYWGIKVNNAMESLLPIQNLVVRNRDGCKTVLAGGRLRSIYLMTNMKPCTWSVEVPSYYQDEKYKWDIAIKYFEYFDSYPDIMFIEPYEAEDAEIQDILNERYYLEQEEIIGDYDICIYKKKAESNK